MKSEWELSKEALEQLLGWLDADRERAAERYQDLHRRLTAFFVNRGCLAAEDLADITFDRATKQLPKFQATYEGDPARYLYGVARNLLLEAFKNQQRQTGLTEAGEPSWLAPPSIAEQEQEAACLEQCLQTLSDTQRVLILRYYQHDKRSKIDQRKQLAEELRISAGALRLRALRVREQLEAWLEDCLKRNS
jgi:RNA polymerase sigma factor (sigma-70 family)